MFTRCPICESRTNHFFNIPFIKENIDVPKKYDMMIQYNRCPDCDYIFAPMFKAWILFSCHCYLKILIKNSF